MRPKNDELREFILRNVQAHPAGITAVSAARFGVSRMTVTKYIAGLIEEGLLISEGHKRGTRYRLGLVGEVYGEVEIRPGMEDDEIWRSQIRPAMRGLPENIVEICQHGFTEMFNNVIDHSGSPRAFFWYKQTYTGITMGIRDYGIGIFEKIRSHFGLADRRHALFELSKGKLTSFPERHSGEGIFFTSRMFDRFAIDSRDLYYSRSIADDGWLIDVEEPRDHTEGTAVIMKIATNATRKIKDVFLAHMDDEYGFAKTHVPLTVANAGEDTFVSRSQARRILARVEKFSEVFLDFRGVKSIGQAFADEIFRVYQREHPGIRIIWVNANEDVERMIKHAIANT